MTPARPCSGRRRTPTRAAYQARQAVTGTLDVAAVLAHRDAMASHWMDDDQVAWLNSVDVDLIRGHGRLAGTRQVAVQTAEGHTIQLTARHAVAISTGTSAALPPMPGIEAVGPWTSREATSAAQVPRRLAVVGGGVVAVEMATAWQALGSQVTMLVLENALLERMEPFRRDGRRRTARRRRRHPLRASP